MDNTKTDFSMPPQWVLDLYNPDKLPPHILVSEGDAPDTYVIQDIDFHAVNLFTVPIGSEVTLPTKGEARIFSGSTDELYAELCASDAKVITTFNARKLFSMNRRIPMAFGHSYDFTAPAGVFCTYRSFLKDEEAYVKNPSQVGLAHNFINEHPLFWHTKQNRDGEPCVVTGRGWQRLDFETFNKKNKETGVIETTVTIETGPGYYHDLNLDVYAPSFDEAVLEMAKLIHTHYDSQGGFTDKRKKEPNDNFFHKWDEEDAARASKEE